MWHNFFLIISLQLFLTRILVLPPVLGFIHGAIVVSLINCFKNFHRKQCGRVKEEQPCEDPPSPNPRTAAGKSGMASAMEQPVVPPSEDTVSFGRHCKFLQAEYKKASRNGQVVVDLMDWTFAFRRQDILSHTYDLSELFDKYPFLQDCEQVWLLEYGSGHAYTLTDSVLLVRRITCKAKDTLRADLKILWKETARKVLK